MRPITPLSLLLSVSALLAATPASAAESYDNCAGTISTLPAVITGQGVWCVKKDLSTAMASGNAITVDANNVTIDCNGFKLGGLAGGEDTDANGVYAYGRANITIRGCNVRGFNIGIAVSGSGHIVEDNRIEGSRSVGIQSYTDGILIRRNMIMDTGGRNLSPTGIYYSGDSDILDNVVTGVFPDDIGAGVQVYGLYASGASTSRVRGNAVRGLTTLGNAGAIFGILTSMGQGEVIDNFISVDPSPANTFAIYCGGASGFILDNRASGFDAMTTNCPADVSENLLH